LADAQCSHGGGGWSGGYGHSGGYGGSYHNHSYHSHSYPSYAQPSYTPPAAPSQPVVISMPATETGTCSYTLSSGSASYDYSITPGGSQQINSGSWQVTYDNGSGPVTYGLYGGEYRFRETAGGWQLYRTGPPAVVSRPTYHQPIYSQPAYQQPYQNYSQPSYNYSYNQPSYNYNQGNSGYNQGNGGGYIGSAPQANVGEALTADKYGNITRHRIDLGGGGSQRGFR